MQFATEPGRRHVIEKILNYSNTDLRSTEPAKGHRKKKKYLVRTRNHLVRTR